jgi:hypothetical protein
MDVEAQLVAALAEQRKKRGGCQTIIRIALAEVRRLNELVESYEAEAERMDALEQDYRDAVRENLTK